MAQSSTVQPLSYVAQPRLNLQITALQASSGLGSSILAVMAILAVLAILEYHPIPDPACSAVAAKFANHSAPGE
jgi:hypothetical protein